MTKLSSRFKRQWQRTFADPGVSILGLLGLFALITLLTVYQTVQQSAMQVLERDASSLLLRWHAQLDATLQRYAYLPEVLAEGQTVKAFLQNSMHDDAALQGVRRYLVEVNRIAHTSVVYLMRPDGQTVATSNWQDRSGTFEGKNFNFRPYFQEAINGNHQAHYFALGTTSSERGYYFAAPVYDPAHVQHITGVVVVKVDVSDIEKSWSFPDMELLVTDNDDIVFMSSREAWLYHGLRPLNAKQLERLKYHQRYSAIADKPFVPPALPLPLQPRQSQQQVSVGGVPYLALYFDMEDSAGWHLYLLADKSRVVRAVATAMILASMMLILSVLLVYLLWKNQRQRRAYEKKARSELAAKVEERTQQLRRTQEELIQAAKMAALGQLSAGINHEINNPLTAIRAYADNAVQFLDIGKPQLVQQNLQQIIKLTEHMAAITRQLKAFSRKSTGQIETCDMFRALDSALNIVQPTLARTPIVVQQERDPAARYGLADQVWLEQILVNLLTNAAEAVQEQAQQHISIQLTVAELTTVNGQTASQVRVRIRDNGPGISDTIRQQVFEAFFTTKAVGKGLGLGLSISYRLAKDMHGDLQVDNAPEGGAIFTLSLPQPA